MRATLIRLVLLGLVVLLIVANVSRPQYIRPQLPLTGLLQITSMGVYKSEREIGVSTPVLVNGIHAFTLWASLERSPGAPSGTDILATSEFSLDCGKTWRFSGALYRITQGTTQIPFDLDDFQKLPPCTLFRVLFTNPRLPVSLSILGGRADLENNPSWTLAPNSRVFSLEACCQLVAYVGPTLEKSQKSTQSWGLAPAPTGEPVPGHY